MNSELGTGAVLSMDVLAAYTAFLWAFILYIQSLIYPVINLQTLFNIVVLV